MYASEASQYHTLLTLLQAVIPDDAFPDPHNLVKVYLRRTPAVAGSQGGNEGLLSSGL
jgi:hypothetical protein